MEGDSAILLSWVTKLERGPWRYDGWLRQILVVVCVLDCISLGFLVLIIMLLIFFCKERSFDLGHSVGDG